MDTRYNVYFAGELLPGYDDATVRANLGRLFKAEADTIDRLFSGEPQAVKRRCDKTTALKYKQAMERAGARPVIRRLQRSEEAPTRAERIAAAAKSPAGHSADPGTADTGIELAPPGTEVLRADERRSAIPAAVAAPDFEVAAGGERLAPPGPTPPPAPDTSHLSLDEPGASIPNLAPAGSPLSPDTSALGLAPEGTDFSDCRAPLAAPPELDLDGLSLAPPDDGPLSAGADRAATPVPPDTSHLELVEQAASGSCVKFGDQSSQPQRSEQGGKTQA